MHSYSPTHSPSPMTRKVYPNIVGVFWSHCIEAVVLCSVLLSALALTHKVGKSLCPPLEAHKHHIFQWISRKKFFSLFSINSLTVKHFDLSLNCCVNWVLNVWQNRLTFYWFLKRMAESWLRIRLWLKITFFHWIKGEKVTLSDINWMLISNLYIVVDNISITIRNTRNFSPNLSINSFRSDLFLLVFLLRVAFCF